MRTMISINTSCAINNPNSPNSWWPHSFSAERVLMNHITILISTISTILSSAGSSDITHALACAHTHSFSHLSVGSLGAGCATSKRCLFNTNYKVQSCHSLNQHQLIRKNF
eukprot:scaffold231657_cov19-Tisochrysis_lutea.AAC.1